MDDAVRLAPACHGLRAAILGHMAVSILPLGVVQLRRIFIISVRVLRSDIPPSGFSPVAMVLARTSSVFGWCGGEGTYVFFLVFCWALVAKLLDLGVIFFTFWTFL
jgi:hypothetical protein